MVKDISTIVLQNYYDRQITVNRIINSSILNYILNAFDYNDKLYKNCVRSIYNYGPKSFLKQLSTESGSCDVSASFPFVDYNVRTQFLENDRNLSGYQYKIKGYKIWANTAEMNDGLLSQEILTSKLITQDVKNQYKTISCNLTADVYDNLSQILDPEIYVKTTGDQLTSTEYLSTTTTINPYYLSNENEKLPSVWKGEYHNTYDYSMISHIVSTYIQWHQNTTKSKSYDQQGHDMYGCYDHSTDTAQFFKGKLQKEIYDDSLANNMSSLRTNSFANVIISAFTGTGTINAEVHNPQTACANTSPIPTDGCNGYEVTTTKLTAAYNANYVTKSIKVVYDFVRYANKTFQLMLKMTGFENIYVNEITNSTTDSSTSFSENNGSSNGNRTLVNYDLPLLNSAAKNVNFKTYIASMTWDGTDDITYCGQSKYACVVNDLDSYYKSLVAYDGMESGQNIIPSYAGGTATQYLIISKVNYISPAWGHMPLVWHCNLNNNKSDWNTYKNNHSNGNSVTRNNNFNTSTKKLNDTEAIVGSGDDVIFGTCGPGTGHTYQRVKFAPLNSMTYNSGWTRTTAKMNLQKFFNEKGLLGNTTIDTCIPIIQATSIAQNRYQFGADNAKYVQTKITNAKLTEFTIEMFNSEDQTLMIRGSLV